MSQSVIIRIGSIGDPPTFPEHSSCVPAKCLGFSILEGGMASGKTSVGIIVEVDGKKGFVEFSSEMFNSLNAASQGAVQRFENHIKN